MNYVFFIVVTFIAVALISLVVAFEIIDRKAAKEDK